MVNQCVKELVCFDYSKNVLIFSKGHLFVSVGQRRKKAKRLIAQAISLMGYLIEQRREAEILG